MSALKRVARLMVVLEVLALPVSLAWGQLNENCTASVLNRTVTINPEDGSFEIPNIPANQGFVRVRITCTENGETLGGQSEFFAPVANGTIAVGAIPLGVIEPPPTAIVLASSRTSLNTAGETVQLTVTGTFPGGTTRDLTAAGIGTSYTTSNSAIATASADGLVTAGSTSGTAIISARNQGVLATVALTVAVTADSDGDGMPDDYERGHPCLNPNVPDANADPDGDGLTNLQEFQLGTDPCVADTDGDGLTDGQEVALGTNPLNPDTDGDGLLDGQEIALGTNPLLRDTDGDGLPDGVEVRLGLNPLRADTDGDGIPDGREDSDADGIANADELALGTDPGNADTDGDGISDGQEVLRGCNPLVPELTTVVGRTLDQQGTPIPSAQVLVMGQSSRGGITDAQGRFSLADVSACVASIQVVANALVAGVPRGGRRRLSLP